MRVCVRVCVCVCACAVWVWVCACAVWMSTCMIECMHVCMYAFVCMSASVHVIVCMCIFVCMCAHVHMHIICVHMRIGICIYVSSVCSMYPSIL